jgi:manganese transport protein
MEYGNRAANIAALAIRNNIELLVMGAHGHAGLKDILFGSTVEAVRHKLNIPILVVR